jgi:hypothetical protein
MPDASPHGHSRQGDKGNKSYEGVEESALCFSFFFYFNNALIVSILPVDKNRNLVPT